jgi:dienelactone hydrolase
MKPKTLLILSLFCTVAVSQTVTPSAWVPSELASKLGSAPSTQLDTRIRDYIALYQSQIDSLDSNGTVASRYLPCLRENVLCLYREYNQGKNRYKSADYPLDTCFADLEGDMAFYMQYLRNGEDPAPNLKGRSAGKICWLKGTTYAGSPLGKIIRYKLIISSLHDPKVPAPVIFYQVQEPDYRILRTANTNYINICNFKTAYDFDAMYLAAKTRTIITDAARHVHLDPFRIYSTGWSYAGNTAQQDTWDFPDWFAAIIAVNSDLRLPTYSNFYENACYSRVPTLIAHGTSDDFLSAGRTVYNNMVACGCPVEWTTFDGGHVAGPGYYADYSFNTDYFDRFVLDPWPKKLVKWIEYSKATRCFWADARTNMFATINARYEIEVRNNNVIEITHCDAAITAFEFMLSDKLVDMASPVKIVLSGDTLYNQVPSSKVTVTLKSGAQFHEDDWETPMWWELDSIRKDVFGYQATTIKAYPNREPEFIHVWPNPFSTSVKIQVLVRNDECGMMNVSIFNINGRQIDRFDQFRIPHSAFGNSYIWDASSHPNGTYLIRIKVGNRIHTKRVALVR